MKIGIISDIHGDYEALVTVLDRLDNHHQVDRVLCAGDLVGRGPYPDQVVSLVRQRGIVTVRGNHDEWSYNLSEGNAAYLRLLPIDWQGEIAGRSVFMCHGKPGNNIWGLYRDHLSDTLLNMMLYSLKVDVLITGHTHLPMCIQVERGCLVNPGSLYRFNNTTRASSHTYGVLHLPQIAFEVFDIEASPDRAVPCET
jgi:putative phosphoesterase